MLWWIRLVKYTEMLIVFKLWNDFIHKECWWSRHDLKWDVERFNFYGKEWSEKYILKTVFLKGKMKKPSWPISFFSGGRCLLLSLPRRTMAVTDNHDWQISKESLPDLPSFLAKTQHRSNFSICNLLNFLITSFGLKETSKQTNKANTKNKQPNPKQKHKYWFLD